MRCYLQTYVIFYLSVLCLVSFMLVYISISVYEPTETLNLTIPSQNAALQSGKVIYVSSKNLSSEYFQAWNDYLGQKKGIGLTFWHNRTNSSMWPLGPETVYDRIEEQLDTSRKPNPRIIKKIFVFNGWRNLPSGKQVFQMDECPVQQCEISHSQSDQQTADIVLFNGGAYLSKVQKTSRQIWVSYILESPLHSPSLASSKNLINWTATYRRDSTIVAPYEKFMPFKNFTKRLQVSPRIYNDGKSKGIAWFVSNCQAHNGRHVYVKELSRYIPVHIFGPCGKYRCPRSNAKKCFEMLNKEYMFYLAFENSNCRDYITEKFYWNALWNDVVPIVMGAAPEDYAAVAPPNSYIHVDDFGSPQALAQYLHTLMANVTLYNQYFQWKGTGHFINTKFWCRLCRMAHEADTHRMWYPDVDRWWRGRGVCVDPGSQGWSTWRDHPEAMGHFFKVKKEVMFL